MSNITPFNFEGTRELRVVETQKGWHFIAADACAAAGILNVSDAVERLDDDEKGIVLTDTPSGAQEMLTVSESGLYTLILRSRKAVTPGTPQHRFRKWVTNEVLPAVRRGELTTQPAHTPTPWKLLQDMRAVLEETLSPFREAFAYQTGADKGSFKMVASTQQAGRIIATQVEHAKMLERIEDLLFVRNTDGVNEYWREIDVRVGSILEAIAANQTPAVTNQGGNQDTVNRLLTRIFDLEDQLKAETEARKLAASVADFRKMKRSA